MKKVTIYSTPTCVYCNAAKSFFKENGIEYSEFNVASDLAKRREMIEKSGQMGVPVITVEDASKKGKQAAELVVGFDEPRLKELLEVK